MTILWSHTTFLIADTISLTAFGGDCCMATNKRVFTLRLQDDVFDKIEYLAKDQHRSMTNFIEFVLLQYLDEYQKDNGVINLPDDED